MAFPIGPTNGQITTVNGIKYVYRSATNSWARLGSAKFTAAASAPSNPAQGDRWYNTGLDILFEFINDGTSNYWVDIQSVGQTGNITSISDSVLNGNIVVGVNNRYSIGTSVGYLQNIYANNITANSTVSNTIVTGSGGLAVDGVGIFGGNLVAAATTSTSSVTTGALVVRGGAGIGGALFTGGIIDAAGNIIADSGTVSTSTTTGALVVNGGVGVSGNVVTGTNLIFTGTGNRILGDFSNATVANRVAFQTSTTNGATSIYILPNGTSPTSQFVAVNNSDPTNASVLQLQVNATDYQIRGGITGTGTYLPMTFYTGGSERVKIDASTGNVVIVPTTTSTSTTTGALVVAGGAGVSGNLYVSNISVGSGNIQFAQKPGMISGATAYLSLLGNPSGSAGISALELAGYTGVAGGTQSRLDFVSKVSNVFYNTSRISSLNGPSSTAAGQLVFSTTPDGGSLTERLRIKDDGPIVTAANIVAVGSATSNTTTGAIVVVGGIGLSGGIIAGGNIVAASITNSVSTTTGALVVQGGAGFAANIFTAGWIIPTSNVSQNLGSSTAWWNLVYGKSIQAQYADLAENYVTDKIYVPGTVVVFGGDAEITATTIDHDPRVAGVISTDPAYLMNAATTGQPVALTGRVPCHVQGPVDKGDLLVTSNIPGVAQRLVADKFQPGCVIGKSLERIDHDEIKLIEVVVGRY
jgi:hypothetical protein